MIKLLHYIINVLGPITIFMVFYMVYYLWSKKVISTSQGIFNPFWPQLVFRFRDLTKRETGKISIIYYLFFVCLISLVISIVLITVQELENIPIPGLVFVGLALFLMLPIVIYIMVLMSKEKYY